MSNSNKTQQTYEEVKAQFETALAKAKKIPGNKDSVIKQSSYISIDGIPHKWVEGSLVPLTRIN